MNMYVCVYIYIYIHTHMHMVIRFHARKRKTKPLRASQSLSETFPCTGHNTFSLKGTTLRGNHVARIGIRAH